MLSWSPRADIEDKEETVLQGKCFPSSVAAAAGAAPSIDTSPMDNQTLGFTHTHTHMRKNVKRVTNKEPATE